VHVIIIGGGITGLAAAYELTQRQVSFTLLESSARLGGLIRTDHVDGFTVEAGPESILAQKPAALRLIDEIGLGPRVITSNVPRTAFVLRADRLHALPSPSLLGIPLTWKALLSYDLLPLTARARLALEPLVPAAPATQEDESVADFFARRFGRASVPLIAQPLLGGIHAGRIDALSIRSLFPRFVDAERRSGSVWRGFRAVQAAPPAEGAFRSLSSGMGEMVSAIGRRLAPGSVRLSSGAVALTREGVRWRVSTLQGDVHGDAVIFAAPAYSAARLLASVDHEASTLCATVPYVSTASVALAYPRTQVAHPLQGSGFVVAKTPGGRRITACTWVSAKWAGRAPQGAALLRAFIGSADDPSAVDLPDDELIALVTRELSGVLGLSGAPAFACVHRWRDAGAQHNVGHLARVAALDARLATLPGLFVAGSGYRAIGIPDCVADGRSAAGLAGDFIQRHQ
jgi:oxygen-dependent protoporphyrinogen oxidase